MLSAKLNKKDPSIEIITDHKVKDVLKQCLDKVGLKTSDEEQDALCQVIFDNFAHVAETETYCNVISDGVLSMDLDAKVIELALEKGILRNARAVEWSLKQGKP